jgi:phage terminase large subunit GpA-like protein
MGDVGPKRRRSLGTCPRRQITFYNAKAVEVSTPTIKNASAIEAAFAEGTMERWCTNVHIVANITILYFQIFGMNMRKRLFPAKRRSR